MRDGCCIVYSEKDSQKVWHGTDSISADPFNATASTKTFNYHNSIHCCRTASLSSICEGANGFLSHWRASCYSIGIFRHSYMVLAAISDNGNSGIPVMASTAEIAEALVHCHLSRFSVELENHHFYQSLNSLLLLLLYCNIYPDK